MMAPAKPWAGILAAGAAITVSNLVMARPAALPREVEAMMARQLEVEIAESKLVACLTAEAERIDSPRMSLETMIGRIHDLCPAQAKVYLAAHQRDRAASPGGSQPEGDVLVSAAYQAALNAKTHTPPRTEAGVRDFEANLRAQVVTGMAYSRCLDRAALKADDHISEPAVIAAKIADACPKEAKADFEATAAGEEPSVVADLRERYGPKGRLESARRAVELMRENPHYDD